MASIAGFRRKNFPAALLSAFAISLMYGLAFALDTLAAGPGQLVAQTNAAKSGKNSNVAAALANPIPGGVSKVSITPTKLAGIATIDVDAVLAEKSGLGFAGSSDEDFVKAVRQCVFVESANTRTLVFDKKYCLAGCRDITEKIKVLLKEGKNQDTEAPIWEGCGTFDRDSVIRAFEEVAVQASLLLEREALMKRKLDSCNQAYNRAKAQGISEGELSAMQARLQGEIDSLAKQFQSETQTAEDKLENTILYATSVFASQNRLNYVFNDKNTFSRCFDLTEPMSKYISKLKMTSSRILEGPNPYKIAVISSVALSSYDRSRIELVCESLRKQKQLTAVVYSDENIWCGATDITNEVLNAIGTR
jgi:Skp family chaperone for outer membrane proteins